MCESRATHLSLRQVQGHSDLVASQTGQVVVDGELLLQLPDLVLRERRPFFTRLRRQVQLVRVRTSRNWNQNGND